MIIAIGKDFIWDYWPEHMTWASSQCGSNVRFLTWKLKIPKNPKFECPNRKGGSGVVVNNPASKLL